MPASLVPKAQPLLSRPHFTAYDARGLRVVDYGGKAAAVLDFKTEAAELYGTDPNLLRELAYLLISSRAGYQLDLRGWHRIHALGLAYKGKGTLVILPSGGGKTRLALDVLRSGSAQLLSEDTPLLGPDGRLYPFPLRLGLHRDEERTGIPAQHCRPLLRSRHGPKVLVDLPFFKEAVSGPVPPGLIVAGVRTKAKLPKPPASGPASSAASLLSSLVVGIGTPQLTEFMLRKDLGGAARLALVALKRSKAAAALWKSCRTARLQFGTDRRANLEALVRLMDGAL